MFLLKVLKNIALFFFQILYCGREELATSAVGVAKVHQKEVEEIETKPFAMKFN